MGLLALHVSRWRLALLVRIVLVFTTQRHAIFGGVGTLLAAVKEGAAPSTAWNEHGC